MSRRMAVTVIVAVAAVLSAPLFSLDQPRTWMVPDLEKLPADKYGEAVRDGKELVESTYKHIGPEVADAAKRYAGNNLACRSCHLDNGTKQFANPMVGVYADFPQYRPREDQVGTIEERINGCMQRSMNGKPLPLDSREMKAMVAYMHYLSKGVPVGEKLEGRGTKKIKLPERAASPAAGKKVYDQSCASCHGPNGQGVRKGVPGDGQGYAFPPLWGPDSYNTGAGMHRVITAANFIRSNMPLGASHVEPQLTDEQAYDVSAYINSQTRPAKANLDRDFPNRKNKPVDAAFPPYRKGFSAEQHKYGPFQPIIEAREKELSKKK